MGHKDSQAGILLDRTGVLVRFGVALTVAMSVSSAVAAGHGRPGPPAATVDGVAISRQSVESAVPTGDSNLRAAQLDAFVNEQLLANAALRAGLGKDAATTAAGEGARRQALARAYLATRAATLGPIPHDDIERYYVQHPELFAKRRIYRIQEIVITAAPDSVAEIIVQFASLDTFQKRRDWLASKQIPFKVGVAVLAAEELPADMLVSIAQLPDGSAFNVRNDQGVTAMQITGIEDKPLTLAQAQAAIDLFLTHQRRSELAEREVKRLRRAAKIEYFPPYEQPKRR